VLNVSELNSFSGILAEPSKSRWPGCAQPLLRAARHFAPPDEHGHDFQRLFAATKFTHHRLAGAAANCGIELPDQQDRFTYRILTLRSDWLSQVTCTHTRFMGGDFDHPLAVEQLAVVGLESSRSTNPDEAGRERCPPRSMAEGGGDACGHRSHGSCDRSAEHLSSGDDPDWPGGLEMSVPEGVDKLGA
jgi:hypothetical protein